MKHHNLRQKTNSKKKRVILIICIAILIIIASIVVYLVQCNMADLDEITDVEFDNTVNIITENELPEEDVNAGVEIVDVSDMPSKVNGFPVIGQIVIEKIGIKCYILETSYEEGSKALEVGTLKFARSKC